MKAKSESINVRLDYRQRAALAAHAAEKGLTYSEAIREAININLNLNHEARKSKF